MASHRKLGKATDLRLALLKNQVSQLLWNGKLETTEARAKEVQLVAEKYITLAVNTYKDTVEVEKVKIVNGKETTVKVINDGANKLAARRTLMSNLADLQEARQPKEKKTEYEIRTKAVRHPLIEDDPTSRRRRRNGSCSSSVIVILNSKKLASFKGSEFFAIVFSVGIV